MSWDGSSSGFASLGFNPLGGGVSPTEVRHETVEFVGPHLRVSGDVYLANNRGYIRLTDAHLMRRNGDLTNLVVPELMVNPDEITFIGQRPAAPGRGATEEVSRSDRPSMERVRRQAVFFTSGHTLTGTIHAFPETDMGNFVDSTDPRFIAVVDVTARSLADRRVISHFSLVLVNRTQMTAASFLEKAGRAAETGVVVE